ncbi:MAG TPA: prepilin-type N-terminal cleavage/methylation domain-containing protein [Syntrophales bacterium]|nr:prepilin-type N-terminal cleavage/methylation domain-containing protein [Syntrophales bacterium]
MIHRHNNGIGKKGLSIIELVFVVLILSLLAAIAIPQLVAYRTRGNSASANIAARQAYGAAESFFSDNPGGTVSVNDLSVYGYNPHMSIILTITGAKMINNFTIQASHAGGGSTFMIDEKGNVTRS